jgi:AcrR family transcriptional regulator
MAPDSSSPRAALARRQRASRTVRAKANDRAKTTDPASRLDDDLSTKDQILLSASGLFLERGYSATSMEAIADDVGITAAALYWHFDSKTDILMQFLETTFTGVLSRFEDAEELTATERLRRLTSAHVHSQLAWVTRTGDRRVNFSGRNLFEGLPPARRRRLERAQSEYLHTVSAILEAGVDSGEFECEFSIPTAFAIVSMCEDVNLWFKRAGPLSADELADLYSDLAIRMVSPVGATPSDSAPKRADKET